jgi:hypothetical protein
MSTPSIRVGDRIRAVSDVTGVVTKVWPGLNEPTTYQIDTGTRTTEVWADDEWQITVVEAAEPGNGAIALLAEGVAVQKHGPVWRCINGSEYDWDYMQKHHGPVKVVWDGE